MTTTTTNTILVIGSTGKGGTRVADQFERPGRQADQLSHDYPRVALRR